MRGHDAPIAHQVVELPVRHQIAVLKSVPRVPEVLQDFRLRQLLAPDPDLVHHPVIGLLLLEAAVVAVLIGPQHQRASRLDGPRDACLRLGSLHAVDVHDSPSLLARAPGDGEVVPLAVRDVDLLVRLLLGLLVRGAARLVLRVRDPVQHRVTSARNQVLDVPHHKGICRRDALVGVTGIRLLGVRHDRPSVALVRSAHPCLECKLVRWHVMKGLHGGDVVAKKQGVPGSSRDGGVRRRHAGDHPENHSHGNDPPQA
mmetsp:Transcript_1078/g.3352  ORF Transcript_1078/g.3352 Transcript_1078/m.3352 type:complete len:257 (-) Transcript_1078:135-905(-)